MNVTTRCEGADRADDFIEHCDVCGKQLDQMNGEDFYDESNGHVYCVAHWPFRGTKERVTDDD